MVDLVTTTMARSFEPSASTSKMEYLTNTLAFLTGLVIGYAIGKVSVYVAARARA